MRRAVRGRLSPQTPVFYGWYIAGGGGAMNLLVFGIASLGMGVLIDPMRQELGWSLAAISLGFSLRSFEQGLLAPISGALVDRLGPRKMSLSGVVLLSGGLLLFSQARDLPVYYAASVISALGQSLSSGTPFNAAVVNWFHRKRARAMGVVAAGRGGGYFVVPLFALLVTVAGWREALVVVALLILVVGTAIALIVRDRPESYGLLPDGEPAAGAEAGEGSAPARPSSLTGMNVPEVLRGRVFYLLTISTGITAGQSVAWTVHQVPHMTHSGFSLTEAGLVVAVYGVVQVAMRPAVGWLADLVGRHQLYIASFVLQGVGLFIFAQLSTDRLWLLPLYYLTYATGHAIWVILFITAVADYFGARRFGTLQGLTSSLTMPFGMLGPFLAGWAFDEFGSYQLIFTIYAPLTALAAIFVVLAGRPQGEFE